MGAYAIQQQLFSHLKTILPPHLSLADELCDLLGLCSDSVYRRIRGDKPIDLLELKLICEKYHISLDQVLQLKNNSVVFQAPGINGKNTSFSEYIKGIISQLRYFNSFEKKLALYLCKDMPLWHFYIYPEIAAFKTFVWIKTIRKSPEYANQKFLLKEHSFEDCYKLGQEMMELYNQIPSIELWNYESIISTIRQIEYYRDAGLFADPKELDIIAESFGRTLDHIQDQAIVGHKFLPGDSIDSQKASLELYVNEVILGNNTILVELNGKMVSYINYNVLEYLFTNDQRFTQLVFANFYTLMSRSTLISQTGEKERSRFFRSLRQRIHDLRK